MSYGFELRSTLITEYADNTTGAIHGTQHQNMAYNAQLNRVRTVTAGAATLDALDDDCLYANAVGGTIDIALPPVGSAANRAYEVVKIDASGSLVNLVGTINGAANYTLGTQWHMARVRSDGTIWTAVLLTP